MRTPSTYLILAMILPAPAAWAQEIPYPKGGDTVACFDRPPVFKPGSGYEPYEDLVIDQVLTTTGRKHLISAVPREWYQIELMPERLPFWETIKTLSYRDALEAMIARFDEFPYFSHKLREIDALIGAYRAGYGTPAGRGDRVDIGRPLPPRPGCEYIQTAWRDEGLYRYDSTIDREFTEAMRAVLQLHEILLQWLLRVQTRPDPRHRPDVAGIELLMIAALGQDHSPEVLNRKIQEYGFRTGITHTLRLRADFEQRIVREVEGTLRYLDKLTAESAQGVLPCEVGDPRDRWRLTGMDGEYVGKPSGKYRGRFEWDWGIQFDFREGPSQPMPTGIRDASLALSETYTAIFKENDYRMTVLDRQARSCRHEGKPFTPEQRARLESARDRLLTYFGSTK